MGDATEQQGAHGDVDHGLGDIMLFVVADETGPADRPAKVRSTTHLRHRQRSPPARTARHVAEGVQRLAQINRELPAPP